MLELKLAVPVLLALTLSVNAYGAEKIFRGEVADSSCALNIHSLTRSHKEMMKAKYMGSDSKSCTDYCVRRLGGYYVLSDSQQVYRLDDQKKAAEFSGQPVLVKGVLNEKSGVVHIVSIEKVQEAKVR